MKKKLLWVQDLTVGYGGLPLFEKINVALHEAQLVCFMGPNGAGKSTLIRTLGGLQQQISGNVLMNNTEDKSARQKQIALVLTDPVKDINMTVFDMVAFGRYPYLNWDIRLNSRDEEIISNAISQVNIDHLRERKIHQLSDGQVQMTMIARALAQDTPIIILDEPTAHLDLNNRVEIMKLLRTLARDMNKAILLATHELDLALQTADLIWLTGNDKNIITGIPEDLVLNGSFDETFKFKGFDLKTGKVQHAAFKTFSVQLKGVGYPFLWTKNALERSGFTVSETETSGTLSITVNTQEKLRWDTSDGFHFYTLADVLTHVATLAG
jgi:iron complex transport system ATP-binding protein